MIAVLEWVKENIAKSGGDPNNVTVIDGSVRAAMTYCLVVSPLTKGTTSYIYNKFQTFPTS